MLIDSHCHLDMLDLAEFDGSLDRAVDAARQAGVQHFLSVAVDLDRWPVMLDRVSAMNDVSVSVGIHPANHECTMPTMEHLVDLAAHPKVVAIGETGLDYHYGADFAARQRESFRVHIRAARCAGKPLIVHTRSAREDTIGILREENASEIGGVLHCFTEDQDMADRAMDLGFYISFSGIVTFRSAHGLRDVARNVPGDRILVETDSPYLSPAPYRGKPNHPARVRRVAEFLAELRGESYSALCDTTSDNFFRLFTGARRSAATLGPR